MDIFSLAVLSATVENLVPEYSFLTREFFPGYQLSTEQKIIIDVRKKSRRIAPFVSPYVQGQLVEKSKYQTMELMPAYIKDKRVFLPTSMTVRTYGEPIGGRLSPQQRMEALVAGELQDQIDMVARRLEVMAGQILVEGKLTIVGELYPEVQLDFQRDASLSVSLSGAAEWGDAGVDPMALLETWSQTVFDKSGYRPRKVIMGLDAYQLFRTSASVVKIFDRARGNNTLTDAAVQDDDGWYAGNIGGFDVYVYAGSYIDPISNTSTNILPTYSVILGGQSIRGYKAFGAILDEKAGLQAMPYFPKSWLVDDPAVRYLMLQSAPILAPLYPDASLYAKVKQ